MDSSSSPLQIRNFINGEFVDARDGETVRFPLFAFCSFFFFLNILFFLLFWERSHQRGEKESSIKLLSRWFDS